MHEIDKIHPIKRSKKHDDVAKKPNRHDSAGASCPENPERGLKHTGTWLKRELNNLGNSKKIFGRAPWRHKESLDSTSTVSSSVRDVLRGATPPTTPTNMKNQRKIDAQFPGGEAIRINTPPLDEDTADGRPRGFFTSTTPPGDGSRSQPSTPTARCPMPRYNIHRSSVVGQSREWWEQMPHLQRRHNSIIQGSPRFEFDIPEHLASSPLCPANAKHKNGGVGLCVYHGRRRATELLREEYLEALNRNGRELM
ncbi:hypothetical protein VHEMI04546 [[Torrubiella] hemipterigena]|uniref:Uncharacterized protein n=1 Tax=[Torrubiella] hemipterigena TaxID=1531966 RepID=A0A0A1TER7_9HYPO|nr:hypothetical protein VHEMI04546 [[Torrubiella] hemipterigena]